VTHPQLDDSYDWLWDASTLLVKARSAFKTADYDEAHSTVIEAINLLDDIQQVLRAEVGP